MSYKGIKFNDKVLDIPQEYLKSIDITNGVLTIIDSNNQTYTFTIPEGVATEDFVRQQIASLVNSAPETLDTLGELATAFEENQDVVDALNSSITGKADKSDLANYVDLTSDQTITGMKTFSKRIKTESGVAIGPTTNDPSAFSVAIGTNTQASAYCSVAINGSAWGNNSSSIQGYAEKKNSIAIGTGSHNGSITCMARAEGAIQIGDGDNTNANTFQVFNYQLLDANGKIPNERLNLETTGPQIIRLGDM